MTKPIPNSIIWFKRDLRVEDNAALCEALLHGSTTALYVIEPALWQQSDRSARHWHLCRHHLLGLQQQLARLGGGLTVRVGEMTTVLSQLHRELGHFELFAHEETGSQWTFSRDQAVLDWCRSNGIAWHEYAQFGVVRGLKDRDGWAKLWRQRMQLDTAKLPPHRHWQPLPSTPDWESWQPNRSDRHNVFGALEPLDASAWQVHKAQATAVLDDFLTQRGERYHLEMSSPHSAVSACSRLSAHLAYGSLSMRSLVQATWQRQKAVKTLPATERRTWPKALSAFHGRLHWHCHFMQKLESEPILEFRNFSKMYDGMREDCFNPAHFAAWCRGETGYPFVDACMRFLIANGWINFRMRAMLVSFASYDLWLHWRETAHYLARLFLDYETGIHYSQVQMQSGTTGINTVRIYNPVKQSKDQDPNGNFIRRWVPELSGFDDTLVHQPWLATTAQQTQAGCLIGEHYPAPIVDHAIAARYAREQVYARRRGAEAQAEHARVFEQHGSRKNNPRSTSRQSRKPREASPQLDLLEKPKSNV